MKILLILEATLGGTGRHVLDLAEGLLRRQCEVHLVYSPLRSDEAFRTGLRKLKARPGFHSVVLAITRSVTARDIPAFWSLQHYVRSRGPFDVVHAHSTKAGLFGRLVATSARKIYTPHALMTMNPGLRGLPRFSVSMFEALLARLTDAVVVVSGEEFRCARAIHIQESRLSKIPNGVRVSAIASLQTTRGSKRAALGLRDEDVCIGFVGRFSGQKAPGRILEAFRAYKQTTARQARLVMVGYGEQESALRDQSAQLGITRDVIWAGQQEATTVMPAFDVLVNASLYEGFSYVMLEALALGIPIVTTRVGGVEEILAAGAECQVIDPWDAQKCADTLNRIIEDGASRRATLRFEVDAMTDALVRLYGSLVPALVPSATESM